MNFRLLRETLRSARGQLKWSLDKAADKSGLNRATIHSIENIKREPDLKPDLETIERLVLAYGLSLSSFFAMIEESRPASEQIPKPAIASAVGQTGLTTVDLDRFAQRLGESLGEALRPQVQRRRKKTHRKQEESGASGRPGFHNASDHPRKNSHPK